MKDFRRSDANVANIIEDFSFDEEVCAFSAHNHFNFNCALHSEHPNAIGSSNASKIGINWFNITHVTHTMNFVTIFHVEIIELDVATWNVDFCAIEYTTNRLDWFILV